MRRAPGAPRRSSADDAEADTLAAAWEVVRPTAPAAAAAAERSRRHLERACARRPGCAGGSQLERRAARPTTSTSPQPETDRLERWPGLLAAAVAAGVLTPRQVVVVAQTRIEGRPLRRGGRSALGRPYGAVRKERQRAEAALRTFARSLRLRESLVMPERRLGCARVGGVELMGRVGHPAAQCGAVAPGVRWPGRRAPRGRSRRGRRASPARAASSAPAKSPASRRSLAEAQGAA